jgi:hypothetical protein
MSVFKRVYLNDSVKVDAHQSFNLHIAEGYTSNPYTIRHNIVLAFAQGNWNIWTCKLAVSNSWATVDLRKL